MADTPLLVPRAHAEVYHCGTPSVLLYMANDRYGAIVVDPARPLPPTDVTFVIVESEWYTHLVHDSLMAGDYLKMMVMAPDEVVFNAVAYTPTTREGQPADPAVCVNAGPNLASAFHTIGGMFAPFYPVCDTTHGLIGVSTYSIAAGQGVMLDLIISQAGKYPIGDHSMRNMMLGATNVLEVAR